MQFQQGACGVPPPTERCLVKWIEDLLQDLGFGIRSLRKTPAVTAIAILSAALGIGASAAVFSVIHGVIIEPFPYKDVDSLMSIEVRDPARPGGRTYYSTDQFLEFASRSSVFDGVVASTISDVLWTGIDEPQRLRGNHVTNGTFAVMGVPPLLGRAAEPRDFAPDAPPIAVLGHRFWQRQFAGDPGVIGRSLLLNGKLRTVVGVMPKRFMWRGADVYLPIVFEHGKVVENVRYVHVLGRLKPGATRAQAAADLTPIVAYLRSKEPSEFPEKFRVGLLSFKETFPTGLRKELWVLFGAVGLLLLVACANVSNLLLTRALARRREMAVRSALGAGRLRIVRQLLTESLIVAFGGGTLGLILAIVGLQAILSLIPPGTLPDESEVAVNLPVLLFALALSVGATIVVGLAPAFHGSRGEPGGPLADAGRGAAGGGRGEAAARSGMVVASLALSLVLLVGASLMVRTLLALQEVDPGFSPEKVLSVRVPISEDRYDSRGKRNAFFTEVIERLESTPGVLAVGINSGLHPLGNMAAPVEVSGNAAQDSRAVMIHQVDRGYFTVVGILPVTGRLLEKNEIALGRNVAVVNESFVRRYSANLDAIGRLVTIPRMRRAPVLLQHATFEIVGVARDRLNAGVEMDVMPEIFIPWTIAGLADRLVLLGDSRASGLAAAARTQVRAVDRNQPVTEIRTVQDYLREYSYAGPRFSFVLFGVFACVGLALATSGVYGVVSGSVSRQTREIGVRIALGATPAGIVSMVMRRGAILLGTGVASGLVAGGVAVRVVESQLWSVSRYDWVSYLGTSLLLMLVGLFACFWPSRRAARVNPNEALRHD
jgi:putative ABC transport system permease protein